MNRVKGRDIAQTERQTVKQKDRQYGRKTDNVTETDSVIERQTV